MAEVDFTKGQSTGVINRTIELLFTQPDSEINLKDHPLKENHLTRLDEYKEANEALLKKVEGRLLLEHGRYLDVRREDDNIFIKLKQGLV